MNFLDRITERDAALYSDLEKKACGYKIVIYGAEKMGKRLYDILTSKGFKIDFAVVDDEYITNTHEIKDIPVLPLSSIVHAHEKYNYIVGFQGFSNTHHSVLKKTANEIFFYDIVRFIVDETRLNTPYCYYERHSDDINRVYEYLEDDVSRDVLVGYINQRISGKFEYSEKYYSKDHYYCDFIPFLENEILMDCGARDGNTVASFLDHIKNRNIKFTGEIYAIEPDKVNFGALTENIKYIPCHFYNIGVWNKNTRLEFKSCHDGRSMFSCAIKSDLLKYKTIDNVDVKKIDTILNGNKITFLKMDIEGSEFEALLGAEKTIKKYKPKLAISLYHKEDDLFKIPELIYSFCNTYKMYLRWHSYSYNELVLYAL